MVGQELDCFALRGVVLSCPDIGIELWQEIGLCSLDAQVEEAALAGRVVFVVVRESDVVVCNFGVLLLVGVPFLPLVRLSCS